jgi:hypothetical protein
VKRRIFPALLHRFPDNMDTAETSKDFHEHRYYAVKQRENRRSIAPFGQVETTQRGSAQSFVNLNDSTSAPLHLVLHNILSWNHVRAPDEGVIWSYPVNCEWIF